MPEAATGGETMRAVVVRSYGGREALEVVEVPVPAPGRGQVRIRVEAAAVNPVDIATGEGLMNEARPGVIAEREHVGIGWDVAGVIDAAGPDVAGFAPGDWVIALRDRLDQPLGTYAEQIVLDAADVAPAPEGSDSTAASTIPLNGLTAIQALDLAALPAGRTILVTGAAGGLGGFVTELAAMRGLRVIAAAGDTDEKLVRGLGATEFVPRSADLAAVVSVSQPARRRPAPGQAPVGAGSIGGGVMPVVDQLARLYMVGHCRGRSAGLGSQLRGKAAVGRRTEL